MPTVLRIGSYRFFFFAGDRNEPRHVHVERENSNAKFWLDPVRLARSGGFRGNELTRLHQMVQRNQKELLKAWNEYFNDGI
jgi:hypothetical protein